MSHSCCSYSFTFLLILLLLLLLWLLPFSSQVAQSQMDALDFIENVIASEGIDCGFTRGEGYLMPGSPEASAKRDSSAAHPGGHAGKQLMQKEYHATRAAGLDALLVRRTGEGGGTGGG